MPNPIMSMLRSQNNQQSSSSGNMLIEFAKFKKQMQGKDAKAMVDDLRASGKMSEQQYQQLVNKAQTLKDFLK